ncbi:MAG: TetR/AcrR family transcriptional regulator [Nitriliruptorales bacterium]|nr:TetR/AcrR family transcriptional regulator [Nitriliruptorales bacterium]
MGRPREHDETTAEALLDAGEELLATGGQDAVSVRAVTRAVEVPTRAVYSLFGSKAGLLQALAARGYRLLADRVDGVAATDDALADLVAAGMEGFRPFALAHPGLFRLTFQRVPAEVVSDATVSEAAFASYRSLVRWIERAQESGAIDGRPAEELAFAFHSCCLGLATSELSREPPPVGGNFWEPVRDVDGADLWRGALEALVTGFSQSGRD